MERTREPDLFHTKGAAVSVSTHPIGILAGNGSLPVEIARAITGGGGHVQIVAIDAAVSRELTAFPFVQLGLGQVGAILKAFRNAGCRELVIVGGATRPDLNTLRPDLGLIANLPHVAKLVFSGGDDGMLRLVVRFFEAKGFTVVSPAELAPGLVVGAGSLTPNVPTAQDTADILLGSSVVKALGAFDVGQAVIVSNGELIAVEAAEGTDRMLARLDLTHQGAVPGSAKSTPRGVLIKRPKPDQEMRVDLPAIGPDTVTRAAQAGLAGIAVLAGQALAAERGEMIARAAAASVFVYGFSEGSEPIRKRPACGWTQAHADLLGKRRPSPSQLADLRRGAAALASLSALTRGGAAVVSRGHILGIETSRAACALIGRAVKLRQWGEGRWHRRMGVVVLASGTMADADIIAAASSARLAGIAIMGSSFRDDNNAQSQLADAAGLFLVRLTPASTGS